MQLVMDSRLILQQVNPEQIHNESGLQDYHICTNLGIQSFRIR